LFVGLAFVVVGKAAGLDKEVVDAVDGFIDHLQSQGFRLSNTHLHLGTGSLEQSADFPYRPGGGRVGVVHLNVFVRRQAHERGLFGALILGYTSQVNSTSKNLFLVIFFSTPELPNIQRS